MEKPIIWWTKKNAYVHAEKFVLSTLISLPSKTSSYTVCSDGEIVPNMWAYVHAKVTVIFSFLYGTWKVFSVCLTSVPGNKFSLVR